MLGGLLSEMNGDLGIGEDHPGMFDQSPSWVPRRSALRAATHPCHRV